MATLTQLSAEDWQARGDRLIAAGDAAGGDAAHCAAVAAAVRDAELLQAGAALAAGRLGVAERLLRPRLKRLPTDVAAMRMLAELAGRLGRYADAETLLRRALALAPSFREARFNLATILHRRSRSTDALAEIDRLLALEPGHPSYRNLRAAALARLGEFDTALDTYASLLADHPRQPKGWMSYGHVLKTVGQTPAAIAAYREAITQAPTLGEAWWSLANLKTVRFDDADVTAMTGALGGGSDLSDHPVIAVNAGTHVPTPAALQPARQVADGWPQEMGPRLRGDDNQADHHRLSDDDRLHLCFALGKAAADRNAAAAAFAHYAEGNRLRAAQIKYDANETTRAVERAQAFFTADLLDGRAGQGNPASDPIFIVGMPRSGSTLIEQILSSHSLVEGTTELPDLPALAWQVGARTSAKGETAYPEALADLSSTDLAALGRDYLDRTRPQRKTNRPRFIDKLPNNWLHVGLIRLILPNATIIDARRHPLACGWSNFTQHFARGQGFSYSLADFGRYYRDYAALMAHFAAAAPGTVHRVDHEAMVADTEATVRALLDHCDLPFEPATLRFWETDRAVRTPSSEQVRQPIFTAGTDAWRAYEPWLGPLKVALGTGLDP